MNKFLKALILDGQISVSVLETTDMVNDAIKIHNLSPVAAAALGRTITGCTFMACGLKNEGDKLFVTVKGNGVGGKITVCGNGQLQMRACVENPTVDLPLREDGKLDVGAFVGRTGKLNVTKSMGLKEPYTGSSNLVSGEIAEDFTAYYALSEQIPTAMALGVRIGKDLTCIGAGGVIVQAMPFASSFALEKAEEIILSLKNISEVIEKIGAEGVMKEYFSREDYQTLHPKYECLCSRDNTERIITSLGKEELLDIIEKEGKVKVSCEFCNTVYEFDRKDVDKIFN